MNSPLDSAGRVGPTIVDCWNKIGVRGDLSCPELEVHVHCRNCPVFSSAAVGLLDADLPPDYLAHWTRHIGQEKDLAELNTHSVVIFRIGAESLALPTATVMEVAGLRVIRSLPHRRSGAVLGLVNIRGELLVCISLRHMLDLGEAAELTGEKPRCVDQRLLVIQGQGKRAVCPVDEVFGIQRFHPRELDAVPATVAKATARYSRSVLSWQKRSVGLLDEQRLFQSLDRSLSLATAT